MADLLFIYGTLLPGHAPPAMASVCRRLRPDGAATLAGRIYDLGHYPGVTLSTDGIVFGELVEVPDEQTLAALDDYEGCPREGEGDGLFRRVRAIATRREDGRSVDCWVYVYERDLDHARVIPSGCWRTHVGRA